MSERGTDSTKVDWADLRNKPQEVFLLEQEALNLCTVIGDVLSGEYGHHTTDKLVSGWRKEVEERFGNVPLLRLKIAELKKKKESFETLRENRMRAQERPQIDMETAKPVIPSGQENGMVRSGGKFFGEEQWRSPNPQRAPAVIDGDSSRVEPPQSTEQVSSPRDVPSFPEPKSEAASDTAFEESGIMFGLEGQAFTALHFALSDVADKVFGFDISESATVPTLFQLSNRIKNGGIQAALPLTNEEIDTIERAAATYMRAQEMFEASPLPTPAELRTFFASNNLVSRCEKYAANLSVILGRLTTTGGSPRGDSTKSEGAPKRRRFASIVGAKGAIRDARDTIVHGIDDWEEKNKQARAERTAASQAENAEFKGWRERQFTREGEGIKATRPWITESLVLAGWNIEKQQEYTRALGKWKLSLDTLLNLIPEGGLVENLSGKERRVISEGNAVVYAYMNAELKRRARIENGKEKLSVVEQQALEDAVGKKFATAAGVEFEFTPDDLKNFYARRGGWLGGFGSDIKVAQRELSAKIFAILGRVPRQRLGFRNKIKGTSETRKNGGPEVVSGKEQIDRSTLSSRERSIIDVLVSRKEISREAADKYLTGADAAGDEAGFAKIDDILSRHRAATAKH